jgi:chromosome segregation ATPase
MKPREKVTDAQYIKSLEGKIEALNMLIKIQDDKIKLSHSEVNSELLVAWRQKVFQLLIERTSLRDQLAQVATLPRTPEPHAQILEVFAQREQQLQQERQLLEKEKAQFNQSRAEVSELAHMARTERSELTEEIKRLKSKNEALQKGIDQFSSFWNGAFQHFKTISDSVARVQMRLRGLESLIPSLRYKLKQQQMNFGLRSYKEFTTGQMKEMEKYLDTIKKLQESMIQKEVQLKDYERLLSAARNDVQLRDDQIKHLESRLSTQEAHFLKEKEQSLHAADVKLKTATEEFTQTIHKYQEKERQALDQTSQLHLRINALEDEKNTALRAVEKANEELTSRTAKHKEKQLSLNKHIKELSDLIEFKDQQIRSLQESVTINRPLQAMPRRETYDPVLGGTGLSFKTQPRPEIPNLSPMTRTTGRLRPAGDEKLIDKLENLEKWALDIMNDKEV